MPTHSIDVRPDPFSAAAPASVDRSGIRMQSIGAAVPRSLGLTWRVVKPARRRVICVAASLLVVMACVVLVSPGGDGRTELVQVRTLIHLCPCCDTCGADTAVGAGCEGCQHHACA
eukprot:3825560-Rhodomonas_salina.3